MDDEVRRTELRFEVDADDCAVLDGHCQATGEDRSTVLRRLLRDWSVREKHRAIVILRVAGGNPAGPEARRSGGGT